MAEQREREVKTLAQDWNTSLIVSEEFSYKQYPIKTKTLCYKKGGVVCVLPRRLHKNEQIIFDKY